VAAATLRTVADVNAPGTDAAGRIRALVVDDEPVARRNLLTLLRRDPTIDVVGDCATGAQALAEIRTARPDLVFLDVEMPECDGFDVLEMLGADAPHAVVFVTAYDKYALRAFEVGALDYLMKPFDDVRFEVALERAKARVAEGRRAPRTPQSLVLKSAGSVVFVKTSDIDWIEAADYYCRLHVGGATQLLRRSLSDLEGELDASLFCRIHRSTIVKLERVRRLDCSASGDYDVVLDDQTRLRLSRRYRRRLQELLNVRAAGPA
jgi:two-component system LytT family response regulator